MYIAVAGNVGTLRFEFADALAEHMRIKVLHLHLIENPYSSLFFDDMHQNALRMQLYSLSMHVRKMLDYQAKEKLWIQDHIFYEDAAVFAPALHAEGILSEQDWELYHDLFVLFEKWVPVPDVLIYLQAEPETLYKNIQAKETLHRSFVKLDYLKRLNERYYQWIATYQKSKVLTFNIEEHPLRNIALIVEKIEACLLKNKTVK